MERAREKESVWTRPAILRLVVNVRGFDKNHHFTMASGGGKMAKVQNGVTYQPSSQLEHVAQNMSLLMGEKRRGSKCGEELLHGLGFQSCPPRDLSSSTRGWAHFTRCSRRSLIKGKKVYLVYIGCGLLHLGVPDLPG